MNQLRPPTAEELRAWDMRRAYRRAYVDAWQVAVLAMRTHCPGANWQQLAAWVATDLTRWRYGRIDHDTKPPEPPPPYEPSEA